MLYLISMVKLETNFVSGAGGFGAKPLKYTQLARTDKAAVYVRSRDGKQREYEVFRIFIQPKGSTVFKKVYEDDTEKYPSTGKFGFSAWSIINFERAMEKYKEICSKAEDIKDNEEIQRKAEARKRMLANLKPFKKGQSGNPAGRPRGAISIMGDIRHILASDPKRRKQYVNDILADKNLRREILQQIDGKPRESIVISGAVEFGRMKELSTQELRQLTGDEYTVLDAYDNDTGLLTRGGGGGGIV